MTIDNPSNLMPDQEIIIEGDAGFVPKASPSDAGKVLGVLNSSGDVGWVVDQSGTFIQVQADWAETDSSQPSYIDHKPDLSVYATASSVETALSGKQDTISDLSEIRAGAAKGDTAVQPSALDDYATTSAMNTALAGKQDTISDLATIRSGASAGATAVQPATLESYATTSAMNTALAGKQDVINDLSDIRSGAAAGATAVQPSALESYATTSAMNTALAGKQDVINDLATIRAGAALGATAAQPGDLPSSDELVPSASSGDSGKVLTVDSNGDPSWQTPASVTVDQTYNASSTNAQSGTAVAQAIAAIPSSSYTAGDGIDITSGEISVDIANTLDFVPKMTPTTYSVTPTSFIEYLPLPQELRSIVASSTTELTIHFPQNSFYNTVTPTKPVRVGVSDGNSYLVSSEVSLTYHQQGNSYYLDEQTVTVSCPASDWEYVSGSSISSASRLVVIPVDSNGWGSIFYTNKGVGSVDLTITQPDPNKTIVTVKNPLPASAQADSGKVLKVNASGNAEWGTDSDTTYTAGNMISIDANNSNAIGVSTTAGITDIQQVAALPANPVATVLYLIPET